MTHLRAILCIKGVYILATVLKLRLYRDELFAARSVASRLLRLSVRIPPGAWMSVSCECFVLSGRTHCVGLITCRE